MKGSKPETYSTYPLIYSEELSPDCVIRLVFLVSLIYPENPHEQEEFNELYLAHLLRPRRIRRIKRVRMSSTDQFPHFDYT